MTDHGNVPTGEQPAIEPVTPAGTPETPAGPTSLEDALKDIEKWKALSRKNEDNAKANKAAADELQTLKDKDLSEQQKLQKALEKAQAQAAESSAQLVRFKVAAEKIVPVELLTGTDEDTLNAQADAILAFAGQSQQKPSVPDFGQGNRGAAAPQDPNAWIRRMAGR